ncbi:MAG TPA: hypothetical protein DD414_10495 [Lachnospiraceae bacterium]|nr:hypothetical protein [Lachnospiraceae bacterium]
MKKLVIPALGVLIGVLALLLGETGVKEYGFTLLKYHNADAKFIGDHIITSVDEEIRILDLNGNLTAQYDGLLASWLYVQEGEEADGSAYRVAYSNHANETHILRLSKDYELLGDQMVLKTDVLAIDPILIKADDTWYLTHTKIDGTINNPAPGGDNGTYTVKLYRSENLKNWEYVTDILSRKKNIEDGDLRYTDGVLHYFFEMEEYDKGPSAICVMTSADGGGTWEAPKELLPAVADNEMAACEPTEEGWRLYVSSDYACVGESYQGASVYYADYTPDFEPVGTYTPSAMPDNRSVRLYEVKETDGQRYFLFARNFLTDCDLLLRAADVNLP